MFDQVLTRAFCEGVRAYHDWRESEDFASYTCPYENVTDRHEWFRGWRMAISSRQPKELRNINNL